MPELNQTNMEYIQKELRRSRLYPELSWKRFERKARLPVFVGLVVLTGIISFQVYAIAQMASNMVYFLY